MLLFPLSAHFHQCRRRHRGQRDRGQNISFIIEKSRIWKAWLTSVTKTDLLIRHPKIQLPYQPQAEWEGSCLPEATPSGGEEDGTDPPCRVTDPNKLCQEGQAQQSLLLLSG